MHPVCPKCNIQVLSVFYFCPNCGKSLKPKPITTSIEKQIGLYLLSFFLPPLGLVPGIKYLLQKDAKSKKIGSIAIILTVISVGLTIYFSMMVVNQFNTQLNGTLNGQINNQITSPSLE